MDEEEKIRALMLALDDRESIIKKKDREIKELKEQIARLKDPIAFHKPLYQGKINSNQR
jgi:peptidoglycan hydrolase CwlO-like protein